MIAIVDYGMGNLRSAQKGLEKVGYDAVVTSDPATIRAAKGVVLPGVGAFKDCYDGLVECGLKEAVLEVIASGTPLLGICVGMQLLFDYGEEGAGSPGLGILAGRVTRFPDASDTGLKVPHMGWNEIRSTSSNSGGLLRHCSKTPYVYFVHSYYAVPEDDSVILATAEYGYTFPAMVGKDNVFGVQFHPEKSQREGLGILKAFGDHVKEHAA